MRVVGGMGGRKVGCGDRCGGGVCGGGGGGGVGEGLREVWDGRPSMLVG